MSQHQPEQQPQQQAAPPAAAAAQPPPAAATNGSGRSTCPPHVLEAIYGPKKTKEQKQAELDNSLQRWWTGARSVEGGGGWVRSERSCCPRRAHGGTRRVQTHRLMLGHDHGFCAGAQSAPCPPFGLHLTCAEYSDRKNDEEDEHVADSLLYDRNHLPRTAPAPECVQRQLAAQRQAAAAAAQQQQQQQQQQQPVS